MKIRGLRIDGFGKFADFECGPLERPVTIFQGANEAGKSTLLAFIRRVLFGFPDGRSRRNPYPPLAGGRHGGSITIVSDAGEIVTVHRVQGTGGGPVTLNAASGEPLPQAELPRLLGHHSRDIFQNVFAFTLDELHNDALLKDDRINSQIYSAGMGASKLPAALKRLSEEKSRLFLKGGNKHAIHEAARALTSVDSGIAEVRNNAQQYGDLSARLDEVKTELTQLDGRRKENQSRLDRQERLKSAWDGPWNELNMVEQELAGLPVVDDFPTDGVSRLEGLEERRRNARREFQSAERDVADFKVRAGTPVEHEAILDGTADVRRLEQGRTSFDNSVRDLPKRRNQVEEQRNTLAATLKDLGADWDETRLRNFDMSLAVREEISRHQKKLRGARESLVLCESNLEQEETALARSSEVETRAEQALKAAAKPGLGEKHLKQRGTLLTEGQLRLGQRDFALRRVADLQDQLDSFASTTIPASRRKNGRTFAVLGIGTVGIAVVAGGAVLGGGALPVGIAAGLALAVISAYLFLSGRSSAGTVAEPPLTAPVRNSLRKAEIELEEAESVLKRCAASLGIETIDEKSLMADSEDLEDERNKAQKYQRLSADLDRARAVTRQGKDLADRAREKVERVRKESEAAQKEWLEWLRARGLRETFAPETIAELRGKVELGLSQLRELKERRHRVQAIKDDINAYAAMVEPLASAFDVALDVNEPCSAGVTAGKLVELHGQVQQQISGREAAESQLAKARRKLKERESDLRSAEEDMKNLLLRGHAADAEDFRKRAEVHRQRAGLKDKRSAALERLQRLSGPGKRLESLMQELGKADIETLASEVNRLEEERDRIAEKNQELSTERGSLEEGLKRLVGEKESSKLRAERYRLLEQVSGHAREWVVRTIAENLLKEARGKFEKERQPDVLRNSQEYFRGMTGGRYQAVFSPLGSSEIHVRDSDGSAKQPDQLSRGAREQLFLALRFGLVRELGQRSERLPLIVDEALVNFDPDRGLKAAQAFMELAEQNQVLVFTCHPQIVDWFVKAAAERGVQPPQTIPID